MRYPPPRARTCQTVARGGSCARGTFRSSRARARDAERRLRHGHGRNSNHGRKRSATAHEPESRSGCEGAQGAEVYQFNSCVGDEPRALNFASAGRHRVAAALPSADTFTGAGRPTSCCTCSSAEALGSLESGFLAMGFRTRSEEAQGLGAVASHRPCMVGIVARWPSTLGGWTDTAGQTRE